MNDTTRDRLDELRKPTPVFASDDSASKRQMQMDITATPIAGK